MRVISMQNLSARNTLINVDRVNQSVSKQAGSSKHLRMPPARRDRVTISSQGKKNN